MIDTHEHSDSSAAGGTRREVIVLDDDPLLLRVMERLLRRLGVDVTVTDDPNEVFRLLAGRRPSLVLVDERMPGLTGAEVVRRIRSEPAGREVGVLIHSALDEHELAPLVANCGADGFVRKTGRLKEVEQTLREWLAR